MRDMILATSALVLMLLAIATTQCAPLLTPLQPFPDGDCTKACAILDKEGCEEGDPSPVEGVPCMTWCSQYHAADYMPPWAACVAGATSVEAIRSCGVECR